MPYLIVFLAALIAAFFLTPLVRRLSLHWGIVAEPGGRRQHAGTIPKLGGLAVFRRLGRWRYPDLLVIAAPGCG